MSLPDRHKHTNEHPAQLTETEMRQGSPSTVNLRVLLLSMMMAVVLGVLLWLMFVDQVPTQPT